MKRVRIESEPEESEIQTIRESDLVPLDEVFCGSYDDVSVSVERRDNLEKFALFLGDSYYDEFVPVVAIDGEGMYILYFCKKEDE